MNEENAYDTPASNLERENSMLSASERLTQSRNDMEEVSAVSKLNFVWGLRLVGDIVFILIIGFAFLSAGENAELPELAGLILIFGFLAGEIYSIIGYFRRKKWCVIPLHIYSGISILNLPIGTIFSIIHYFNMHKVQFDKHA